MQVRGGRYSVSVDARVEGRPKAIAPPEGAAEGALAAARGVGLRRRRDASGRSSSPAPRRSTPRAPSCPRSGARCPRSSWSRARASRLEEVRRGEAEPPPDALTLARELWLDPDGRGASVRDRFGGTLRATTRLDLLPPGTLGRIAVDGQDQLVTAHPETKAAGVELRRSALQLEADSRLALGGRDPRRRLDDRRRAAPGDAPRPARLEPPRRDRRRSAPRHLDLALDAARLLLRPDRDAGRPSALRPAARAPRPRRPRPHPRRARRALRRLAEPRRRDRAPAGRSRRPDPAPRASLVPRERRRARRRGRALRARPGEGRALPAGGRGRRPAERARLAAGRPAKAPAACRAEWSAASWAASRASAPRRRPSRVAGSGGQARGAPAPSSRGRRKRCRPSPSSRSAKRAATPTTSPSSRTRRPCCRRAPASRAGPGAATRSRGADPWAATTRCGSSSLSPGMNRLLTLLRLALARGVRLRAAHRPLAGAPPPAEPGARRRVAALLALAASSLPPRRAPSRRRRAPRSSRS